MHLMLTVVNTGTGACADVAVQAPIGTAADAVLARLREVVGADPDAPVAVGGRRIPSDGAVEDCGLRPGDVLEVGTTRPVRLGTSELRLESAPSSGSTSCDVVHRPPRFAVTDPAPEVAFPAPPTPVTAPRIPVLAAVAPLVAGLAICLVLRQWEFLAVTALSPVMVFGQAAGDRRSVRRANRAAATRHRTATAGAADRLATELATERSRRHAASPCLSELTAAARTRGPLLWQRSATDPDALLLRLGRGDLPSQVRVTGGTGPPTVVDVPVCVPLAEIGVLGVAGPPELAASLIRALTTQAITLHSPADLQLVVLAPAGVPRWGWVRWLPHVVGDGGGYPARLGFDDEQIARRVAELAGSRGAASSRRRLVVVDASIAPAGCHALRGLLTSRDESTAVIWCAPTAEDLPAECRAVITVASQSVLDAQLPTASVAVVPDLMSPDLAAATARALAPLRPAVASAEQSVPGSVRWSEVSRIDLADCDRAARSLTKSWQRGPSTRVVLGRGSDREVVVDLAADGPHALIAGTTGSGKSELLLGLVASLAAANRPDQLGLLLIDHKGGTAFGPLARLPHTVGVVTDLDAAATTRALLCLGAELRRREARLAADPADPLPRLVLVVDEFATLAEEQPDFIGGLVGIAQRGRSLGVHLVLATQRPDGAVCADIRANTRLRICLGVAREHESRDVIDCPDAAAISRTTPGRGYLRIGPGELLLFQTAQISHVRTRADSVSVDVSPAATLGDPAPVPADGGTETDLDVLIDAAHAAASALQSTPVPAPWLPELPRELRLSELPIPPGSTEVTWGLVDLPAAGRQPPLRTELAVGATTLIVGAARSGRTTATLALATAIAARCSPDAVHLWGIDAAAGLAPIASLPHCGSVVPAHDTDRSESVLDHLADVVARRRRGATIAGPASMLIIDGWDAVVTAAGNRAPDLLDRLVGLAVDGPSAGLHLVIAGDRGLLTGRLASAATERIVMRLADPSDLMLLGMSVRDLPRELPPGRGIRGSDRAFVQIAVPDAATTAAAHRWAPPTPAVRRFAALPERVRLAALHHNPAGDDGAPIRLGLEAGSLDPVVVDRTALAGGFVVVGQPGSGRSTAMALIASQLRGRAVAVCCSERSPLASCPGTVRLPRDDQDHAVALLDSLEAARRAGVSLLVDDLDQLPEGPLWARLEQVARDRHSAESTIVASASTDAVASAFRGPLTQLRQVRNGLLLGEVSRHDGELLGLRLPARCGSGDPPGRGWLVAAGRGRRLQLADPEVAAG